MEFRNEYKNATILIVDDNPTNLGVLFDYLIKFGFNVLINQSGEKALSIVETEKPDIILLDIMMPGIDGYETCKRLKLKEEPIREIPVIFMSALTETVDKVMGFEVGAVDYITKPFQYEEVMARINAHLTIKFQQEKMKELNATKNKFFSIIAKDLKSPLASIISATQLLEDNVNSWDKGSIQKTSKELSVLSQNTMKYLSNLLEWSSFHIGIIKFFPVKTNVGGFVKKNFDIYKNIASTKNITLTNEVESNVVAYADEYMLDSVLRNLISNALKFTVRNGEIKVGGKIENDHAVISISDTGMGIRKDLLEKIFKVDQSISEQSTNIEKGSGLGMILCNDYITENGGKIWVDSEIGKGTIVYVSLPVDKK